jgi:hypothetical protein
MKLRNKKTGEIGNLVLNINPNRESYTVLSTENGDTICGNLVVGDYDTLAGLNEEWQDYEELKEFWYICDFRVVRGIEGESSFTREEIAKMKSIGNYFETEEEAEKAVEKLKAWKRLKNGGFKFKGYYLGLGGNFSIKFETGTKCNTKDLDLLFGGEE